MALGGGKLFSLLFGAGSIVGGGSYILSDLFGADKTIRWTIQKEDGQSIDKEWINLIGASDSTTEGIFVKTKGTYSLGESGNYSAPARIGTISGSQIAIGNDDETIMIVSGENGFIIFRGKRHFESDGSDLNKRKVRSSGGVNSEIWNQGKSSQIKDEEPNYYCKGRTDKWVEILNKTNGSDAQQQGEWIGIIQHPNATGPYSILHLFEPRSTRLKNTEFKTDCRGLEMFYPTKVGFFTKNKNGGVQQQVLVPVKTKDKKLMGSAFNLGKVSSVLYGRNKDLRITKKGLKDAIGNTIEWGTFIPKIQFK